ncbi:hypothetical protein Q5P01_000180 [Channa striata]|uniref:Uncharacterized protein n=1 Tax=Channa striata TaxID=64152 RepID=A0AA88IJY7_CHASR|nr:hypothetical protein Q5P01_000180 [Channa striata]
MSCVEAGDTGDVGRQASDAVQGEPAERQVRHRGAVLPESQSRFLEEIVPVSSEAESASGQLEAPARAWGGGHGCCDSDGAATGGSPAPSTTEGGGLPDPQGEPPPARATCSVSTMTDQRTEVPNEWGVTAVVDKDSQLPGQCSPRVQRTHRRSHMPAVQTAENTGHQSEGEGTQEMLAAGLRCCAGEPAERQVRHRGAVLPESQSRFLEEIVPVSSEAESASGQLEAPAPRGDGGHGCCDSDGTATGGSPAPPTTEGEDCRILRGAATGQGYVFGVHDDRPTD